jgi:hypothetical protein
MTTVAIYARYSSNQNAISIDDQPGNQTSTPERIFLQQLALIV